MVVYMVEKSPVNKRLATPGAGRAKLQFGGPVVNEGNHLFVAAHYEVATDASLAKVDIVLLPQGP